MTPRKPKKKAHVKTPRKSKKKAHAKKQRKPKKNLTPRHKDQMGKMEENSQNDTKVRREKRRGPHDDTGKKEDERKKKEERNITTEGAEYHAGKSREERKRGERIYWNCKKKPVTNQGLQQAPPLRHIGLIVIWEGNYRPDILFIGIAI